VEKVLDIPAIHVDFAILELDPARSGGTKHRVRAFRVHTSLENGQRDRPVEAAGVHIEEARILGAPAGDGTLSDPCRAVNCH
jgi:hypothetical protein